MSVSKFIILSLLYLYFVLLHYLIFLAFIIEDIITNARKGADLQNAQTGKYLEIDFEIPELSLCFEYQVCKNEREEREMMRW